MGSNNLLSGLVFQYSGIEEVFTRPINIINLNYTINSVALVYIQFLLLPLEPSGGLLLFAYSLAFPTNISKRLSGTNKLKNASGLLLSNSARPGTQGWAVCAENKEDKGSKSGPQLTDGER